MKVDEVTLQNILKTYGKELRTEKTKEKTQKPIISNDSKVKPKLNSEDLDAINYDNEGKIKIDSQKKEALIDFFQ